MLLPTPVEMFTLLYTSRDTLLIQKQFDILTGNFANLAEQIPQCSNQQHHRGDNDDRVAQCSHPP